MTINVLDLDLDFFLDDIAYNRKGRRSLSSSRFSPWQSDQVRLFLEHRCGLSRQQRITGKLIEEHDEAYPIFEGLAAAGALAVTHVDAHSDLAFGDVAWYHIIETLLEQPMNARTPPQRGKAKLNQGNYLAYAVACGLVSHLTYVHHPSRTEDVVRYFFRNQDPTTGFIEMPWVPTGLDEAIQRFDADIWGMAVRHDPPVPFVLVPCASFTTSAAFDHAILCRSPAYTPSSADALIPVFKEFIDFP